MTEQSGQRSHCAFVRRDPEVARWSVDCWCGFEVTGLDTFESADDTANWHDGRPSLLGSVGGPYEEVESTHGK